MLFSSVALFVALAGTVNALTAPHAIGRSVHHRAIAARAAMPEPQAVTPARAPLKRKRASNSGRCKPRSSSAAILPSSSALPVVGNVGSDPDTAPTSQAAAPTEQAPPPAPTTHVAPSPTTKKSAPATTAASSPPASSGDLPSYLVGTQTGQGTFYATGLGSCGITNHDTDFIAAVSHLLYDTFPGYTGGNPNNNPVCGRKVTAHYQGKSVTVTITDRCTGCALTDLDFSPAAFNTLADPAIGRISGMTWDWD